MNIVENYKCPYCEGNEVVILSSRPILTDVRVDTLRCNKCSTTWNLYSKIAETNIELLYVPQADQQTQAPAETVAEKQEN